MTKEKEYIVIYKSMEHFEVLGFVMAGSMEEAEEKAQKELLKEAKHYKVVNAEIAEMRDLKEIFFNIF